jgi:haloalkane dehalogenase
MFRNRLRDGGFSVTSELKYQNVGDADVAYREYGSGDPLLLIHGYPLTGDTFRNMVPLLASHFRCIVLDLPGAGESRWTAATQFDFQAQAEALKVFADKLGLTSYSMLAHNTGGTIARQLSLLDPQRVRKQVLIGTEIPHHRPPWIRFFQITSRLPGSDKRFKKSMSSAKFLHSSMGFGGCFFQSDLIDGEFHRLFVQPMLDSERTRDGQIRRLQGIDWRLVDSLGNGHGRIQSPVLLIWGEDDPVFPVAEAKRMLPQFHDCRGLIVVPRAKLFVHEEHPETVTRAALDFLMER